MVPCTSLRCSCRYMNEGYDGSSSRKRTRGQAALYTESVGSMGFPLRLWWKLQTYGQPDMFKLKAAPDVYLTAIVNAIVLVFFVCGAAILPAPHGPLRREREAASPWNRTTLLVSGDHSNGTAQLFE